jgi:hypothetical protein
LPETLEIEDVQHQKQAVDGTLIGYSCSDIDAEEPIFSFRMVFVVYVAN